MRLDPTTWARVLRCDRQGRCRVDGRHVYILPTRYGLMFAALVVGMLLGSLNYGNNPGMLLTFVLAAIGANAIYMTWRNLVGLELVRERNDAVFAGEAARFRLRLSGGNRERPAIQIQFSDPPADDSVWDVSATPGDSIALCWDSVRRGWLAAPRLTASTRYPFGLLRAWCYIEIESRVLIYPKPVWHGWRGRGESSAKGQSKHPTRRQRGDGDFDHLRPYRDGDPMHHIHWKAFARSERLVAKIFDDAGGGPVWLDLHQTPGADMETRLGILCGAVMEADRQGTDYGLRLGGQEIGPGRGGVHRQQCLRALALFGGRG